MPAWNMMLPFFKRQLKKLSWQFLLLLALFIVCCWGILAIADMVFEDKSLAFDKYIFRWMERFQNPVNTGVMQFITFFGSHLFLLPANILLAAIFLFLKNHRSYSLKIVSVSLTSTAVMFLLKSYLKRERPMVPLIAKAHGYSFPSGHSFTSFVFFGMLAYISFKHIQPALLKWLIVCLCFAMAILVGISRVYLQVHYASDVIAGFLLGIIWLLLAQWIFTRNREKLT